MSIRIKLISILLFISMVPIVFLSVVGLQMARESLREEIGSKFENMAIEKARAIETILNSKIEETVILATHPIVIDALRKANSRYSEVSDATALDTILTVDKEWVSQKGKTQTASTIAANALSVFFKNYQDRNLEKYGEIFVTDNKGANVAMTKALSDYYQADESWWKESFSDGKGSVFIDDRGYDESVGAIVVGAVVPVKDGGEAIGILKINFKVTDIIDVVSSAANQNKQNIVISIARNSGSLVISSKGGIQSIITESEKAALNDAQGGWMSDEHGGVKTILGYAPISAPIFSRILPVGSERGVKGEMWHKTTWFTLLDIEQDTAFTAINKMTMIYLISGLVAILAVTMIALRLAANISHPINQLCEGAQAIAAGRFDNRFSIDRNDELGVLANAFTKMQINLAQYRDHLEELVENRTSEVKKSEEKYRLLYNDTPVMQHSIDQDMRIVMVSDYWLSYLGYTRDEVIGRKITDFQTEASCQTVAKTFPVFEKTGKVEDVALQFVKSNGEVIDVLLSAIQTLSAQGEFGMALGVMIDVTEEMRAKEELKKALEGEKEYSTLQSKFISLVSHEFRTPLTIIDSTAQRLVRSKKQITPEILREKSEKIRFAVGRMTDLIENTLYAARLEENKIELTPVPINLGDMVREVCSVHGDISPDHDISVDVMGLPSTIAADEKLLGIIFTNLLSNAVKFALNAPSIEVTGWTEGKHAVVSVTDHGVGIPEDELTHMFDRFFRAKTADGIKGTGIGLNVSKEFVEMHGGEISVDSIEGEGSTFTVRLPIDGAGQ